LLTDFLRELVGKIHSAHFAFFSLANEL